MQAAADAAAATDAEISSEAVPGGPSTLPSTGMEFRTLPTDQVEAMVAAIMLRYIEMDIAKAYRECSPASIWKSVEAMGRANLLQDNDNFEVQYAALTVADN